MARGGRLLARCLRLKSGSRDGQTVEGSGKKGDT